MNLDPFVIAKANAAAYAPALEALAETAEAALSQGPFSVTDKELTPPSGDKHDYLSYAPYWWPDPARPDGRPYIRRDGEVNPACRTGATDRVRLENFAETVEILAWAAFFLDRRDCAARAGRLLQVWFLDPDTRMHPYLEHGQAIPGTTDGRGLGIIETRHLLKVVTAIELLIVDGGLSAADASGLCAWFEAYRQWLAHSRLGRDERGERNNHGTWYDVQAARFALFCGDRAAACVVLESARGRLPEQFAADGGQPHELARTRSLFYSILNLTGWYELAAAAAEAGLELWTAEVGGPSALRAGLDFLVPFAVEGRPWPHPQIDEFDRRLGLPLLLQAAEIYGGNYRELAERLPDAPRQRCWLRFPTRPT